MLIDKDPYRCFMPYEPVPVASAPEGPLAGLTLAVKDIYDVAGYRTGSGCPTALAMSEVKTRARGSWARPIRTNSPGRCTA